MAPQPDVTVSAVISADIALNLPDFRSGERTFNLLTQVAGRAGREDKPGEVLIQTAFPEHPFWQRLIDSGYAGVSQDALEERAAAHWPPFSRLALIRSAAHKRTDAHAFLGSARHRIEQLGAASVRVFGPVDAVMGRRAGRYRAQLLLQTADRRALHAVLRQLRPILEGEPTARKVRWSIDVDPIELF